MENTQQLEAQIIQLKARLLDARDSSDRMNEVIGVIARKIGYQGQDVEGLISAVNSLVAKEGEVVHE